jgi:hypothetical protein
MSFIYKVDCTTGSMPIGVRTESNTLRSRGSKYDVLLLRSRMTRLPDEL